MKQTSKKSRVTAPKSAIVFALESAVEIFSTAGADDGIVAMHDRTGGQANFSGDAARPLKLEIPFPDAGGSICFQLSTEPEALAQVLKAAKKLPVAAMAPVKCPNLSRPEHTIEEQREIALRIYGDDAARAVERLTDQLTNASELGLDAATVANLESVIESIRLFRPASFPPPLRPGADFAGMEESELLVLVGKAAVGANSAHIETGKALYAIDQKRPAGSGTLSKYVRAKSGAEIPDHAFCCAVAFNLVAVHHLPERCFDTAPLRWLLQISAILNECDRRNLGSGNYWRVAHILQYKPADGYKQLRELKRSLRPEAPPAPETPANVEAETPAGATVALDLLSSDHLKLIGQAIADCQDPKRLAATLVFFEALLGVTRAKIETFEPALAA